jgi:hypothetical protein
MLIRIFAAEETGFDKYLNFLRMEMGGGRAWEIQMCDPMTWLPGTSGAPGPADINIHVETPLRLAIPWAKFNVFVTDIDFVSWAWTKTEMDYTITKTAVTERATAIKAFRRLFQMAVQKQHPPALPISPPSGTMPPKVAVITPTRNRRLWWPNMVMNVMKQSWPVSRIEWIIVDDGDDGQRLGADVEEFMEKSPGIVVRYVEITTGPMSIGAKRNAAVTAAADDIDVFVCMDDDDHYPKDSIAKRVSWLTRDLSTDKKQAQIVYCSVIAMYDLKRYISAMNVPELELAPAERVSEATLAFTREAWAAKPFPDESVAEGFGFLEDREALSVEIPPRDVIVSFIHLGNSTSRRMPKDQEPNGCHYGFPDEYFRYVHKVGGGMED